MIPRIFAVVPLIVTVTATNAQFTGDYAPETWTVSGLGGGASAEFSADGQQLTIMGGDGGFFQNTDVTHAVVTGGIWTFDWWYESANYSSGFDNAYYLLNGSVVFLATSSLPTTGSVSIPVASGDVIGWRVDTLDGIFGPGTLVITNFQIPGPAGLGLFAVATAVRLRRRSRIRSRSPTPKQIAPARTLLRVAFLHTGLWNEATPCHTPLNSSPPRH